jgi:serine/threonine-protein kinase
MFPQTHWADRNLLIGIIALQMDFISRDQLIAAMHASILSKASPLSRILLDQGALSDPRRALLDALVDEHIKLHAGDPQRSLAALSSIASVRHDLSRIPDQELQASLPLVSAARAREEPAYDPFRTQNASVGESKTPGVRFRILRPHAKGGLGQVSVALDTELDRTVALKEIQDEHADDQSSRFRFVQEAEITGKLEHPGIVPIYGLGHYADGRPFYAMRFVQGDSLKEAITRFHAHKDQRRDQSARTLQLRDLLRRFTDVCNAVAYAHSRGVLHRDLKPGNVMLGPFGETLLVDWGLAKPMEDAAGPIMTSDQPEEPGPIRLSKLSGSRNETLPGKPIGTPAFMSPEQAHGQAERLGERSDVYSLGATLYSLLTGRAPYEERDLGAILRAVQKGEFPAPKKVDSSIDSALEAICLKAMALKAEDRYGSARELARDVERWLADEPVAARRDPPSVWARRWMRRHRILVATAGTLLLVSASAAALVAWQQAAYASVIRRKNLDLVSTNAALDVQRRKAEEREQMAIDAVKRFRSSAVCRCVGSRPRARRGPRRAASLQRCVRRGAGGKCKNYTHPTLPHRGGGEDKELLSPRVEGRRCGVRCATHRLRSRHASQPSPRTARSRANDLGQTPRTGQRCSAPNHCENSGTLATGQ